MSPKTVSTPVTDLGVGAGTHPSSAMCVRGSALSPRAVAMVRTSAFVGDRPPRSRTIRSPAGRPVVRATSATDSPCPVRAFFTMSQKSSSSGIRMPSGDRRGAMGLHFSSSVTGSLFNGPCSLTHPTGQSRLAPQKVREARLFQYRPSQTPQQCCERRSFDHDCPSNEQEFAPRLLPLAFFDEADVVSILLNCRR